MADKKTLPMTTMLIYEAGRPVDSNDWSKYERIEIEIEPTLNLSKAAEKADKELRRIKSQKGKREQE